MNPKLILCLALVLGGGLFGCATDTRDRRDFQPPQTADAAKVKLKFVKVDSEETDGQDNGGENAVDGNPDTYWHTQWQGTSPGLPHEIIIELCPPAIIKGFTYLPRQDESDHGTIKDYEFYVSDDGANFGQPVKTGAFEPGKEEKIETFEPIKCRFIKLKAISEINGQQWTSAAEIEIIQNDENVDLVTNPINHAEILLENFKKTKSLDQLQAAYVATGNIPEPGADKTARQEKTKVLFNLLAAIDQNMDTNFYSPNNPNYIAAANMYYPGMELKLTTDTVFRAQFKAAVRQNDEKIARLNFQTRLHHIDQSENIFLGNFLPYNYTASEEDQSELENLMQQAELSPARMKMLKALFEPTKAADKSVDTNFTKQIPEILTECQKIKPGMTRAVLLKVFATEGGLSTAAHQTFVYRGCPYIKVDVDFTLSNPKQKMVEERPTDTISKISKPYLDWSIID